MSRPESEGPSDLGCVPDAPAHCPVPDGARRLWSWCSITVITHLAHTQSSFNFYLQEHVLSLLCLLPTWFFWWEGDLGIHGQDGGEPDRILAGKMRSSEGLDSPNWYSCHVVLKKEKKLVIKKNSLLHLELTRWRPSITDSTRFPLPSFEYCFQLGCWGIMTTYFWLLVPSECLFKNFNFSVTNIWCYISFRGII